VKLQPLSDERGSRVSPETTVRNAISLMLETGTPQVVVVEEGRELGVFRLQDAGALL
jgi:FOG: CBS domain